MANTADSFINVLESWIGFSEYNGKHKQIIDIYNAHTPLARGYKVKYTDSWCDATISAAAIKSGNVDIIGTECGCEQHVNIFKQKGIWIEDGTITPKRGDIILYNWDQSYQPNNGYSDHIGAVVSVSGNQIKCIEGNKNNSVSYRYITVGNGNIRGYARPKWSNSGSSTTTTPSGGKSVTEVAKEVLAGKWGNGDDRKKKLEAAGYNFAQVQAKVNELMGGTSTKKSVEQIAKEVLAGTWGNGDDRKKKLEAAGYNYTEVQNAVNKLAGSSTAASKPVQPSGNQLIKDGQVHLNNFCGAGLTVDGQRGSATMKGIIKALQRACNLDYGSGLTVDGIWGPKTDAALGNHYVKKGETQYLVTFVEAALYCWGFDPKGCESPGTVGSGCDAAIRAFQQAKGLSVDGTAGRNTILKLCGR